MLLDQDVLKEQIEKATHRLDRDGQVTAQQRLNFEMSVKKSESVPGAISANTVYVASYHTNVVGHYSDEEN